MTVRTWVRVLGLAPLAAVLILTAPAGAAHAVQKNPKTKTASECLSQGYEWDPVKGCADKQCPRGGGFPQGSNGDIAWNSPNGLQYCDGFTGKWTEVLGRPKPAETLVGAPTAVQGD